MGKNGQKWENDEYISAIAKYNAIYSLLEEFFTGADSQTHQKYYF